MFLCTYKMKVNKVNIYTHTRHTHNAFTQTHNTLINLVSCSGLAIIQIGVR